MHIKKNERSSKSWFVGVYVVRTSSLNDKHSCSLHLTELVILLVGPKCVWFSVFFIQKVIYCRCLKWFVLQENTVACGGYTLYIAREVPSCRSLYTIKWLLALLWKVQLLGWDLIVVWATGRIWRGKGGPHTKSGWLLSSPVETSELLPSAALLTTHTLRMDCIQNDTGSLDDRLRSFKSFSILNSDKSVYDRFEESICFRDGRYEVVLP